MQMYNKEDVLKKGLTVEAKSLMKERDMAGKEAQSKSLSPIEKKILHEKYKKLRNRIRKDTIKAIGERMEEANNE